MGAALGWTPRQVDQLTFWELHVAVEGWRRAQGVEEDVDPPSPEEHDALAERFQWMN